MSTSPPIGTTLFNPHPVDSTVALTPSQRCYVIDDALTDPQALVDFASSQAFASPVGYPYPGVVLEAPSAVTGGLAEYFAQQVRGLMGARRTIDVTVRLSLVTTPAAELEPRQWQCHRDRIAVDPQAILFAASVLYLFDGPALGGTSFYLPRLPAEQMDRMLADSQTLSAAQFSARHGVEPGYMTGSNTYFERIASVPAKWNRLIFYDGGIFHSADIAQPALLSADPKIGRLTLNGFYTCKRNAR